jgi:hypothetical protein
MSQTYPERQENTAPPEIDTPGQNGEPAPPPGTQGEPVKAPSKRRPGLENQQLYIILGVVAFIALACIGAFTYSVGQVTSVVPVAPTNTPLPPPVVSIQKIKAQAELSTVEYNTVTEIYNENAANGWLDDLLGNKERLLMMVYGDVEAGFDLSKLDKNDLWSDGERVRLVLPAPEILNSSIDFDRTHIVFYDNNLIFDENNPNLQGEALKNAKAAIEEAALREGVLDQANQYGKVYFENLLYSLGFTDVEVVVDAQFFGE